LSKGVKVENVSFDALVAGQAKGFDIALSQVTITDDRAKVVDFSVPYFASDQGVLVNKGTEVPDLAAAKHLQWGVQQSTTGQTFLDDVVKPAKETRVYGETSQAFTALQAKQIDAVLLDTAIVLGQAAQPGSPFVVAGQFASGEAYGAVLAKGSSIRGVIDEQLTAMRDDGTLDRLRAEYLTPQFGADPTKVPYIKVT
jgi:polar amino acid transport system substrate-binding protein